MNTNHILSSFDRDLEGVQAHLMKMGGLVEAAIHDAANALENGDTELAEKTRKADRNIDALDELINEEAARLIALRAPTAIDLRLALSVLKISASLERIGDFAKNMAKRSLIVNAQSPVDGVPQTVRRMARLVEKMLADVLDAYMRRDDTLAAAIIQDDEDVDQMYNGLFREILTFMMEDPRSISACMHYHFMAKNVERMGDHVTAIAEQVIYLTTGQTPGAQRETRDLTSIEPALSAPEDK
jgi:phosphate transport system protein